MCLMRMSKLIDLLKSAAFCSRVTGSVGFFSSQFSATVWLGMDLPPRACWELEIAGQEYQIPVFHFYGQKGTFLATFYVTLVLSLTTS